MTARILENIVWHTLSGPHAAYTEGNHLVRRYAKGFPPIAAFSDLANPDFHCLAQLSDPGERLYCEGWAGSVPARWRIESEATLIRMTWEGIAATVDAAPDAVRLDARTAGAALALAALTRPGPFTLRTVELGEYFGIFDGATLIAMAGSRTCAGRFGEISGVCCHPSHTGRGMASRLVAMLLQRMRARGEAPFLRVMKDRSDACRIYRKLGFRDHGESVARTIVRL